MIVAGAVLAGGASRRMGRPKAFIEIDGVPMVGRVVAALREAGIVDVAVVGGASGPFHDLGLAHVSDLHPGEGPLGGIVTSLTHHAPTADAVAVVSCDLLDPSPIAVRSLIGSLGSADVAVPVVDDHPQWTHAIWRTAGLGTLEAAFAGGARAPRDAVGGLEVVSILDGAPGWYADADTPSDLPPPAR